MKHCIRNKTQHCLGEAQKQFESVIGRVMMDLQPYLDFMDIMRDNCRVIDSMKCHMIQGPVSVNGAPLLLPFLLFVQTKNTIIRIKTAKIRTEATVLIESALLNFIYEIASQSCQIIP